MKEIYPELLRLEKEILSVVRYEDLLENFEDHFTKSLDKIAATKPYYFVITNPMALNVVYFCPKSRVFLGGDSYADQSFNFSSIKRIIARENIPFIASGIKHFLFNINDPYNVSFKVLRHDNLWRWMHTTGCLMNKKNDKLGFLTLTIVYDIEESIEVSRFLKSKNSIIIQLNSNEIKKLELLTTREKEILIRINKEPNTKELAKDLNISQHTLRTHIKNIKKKLNVRFMRELYKFGQYLKH